MTKLFKRIKKPNEKRVIDFLVELGMSSDYRYTSYQSIEESYILTRPIPLDPLNEPA